MLQHAFPVPFKSALHKRQEQIRDARYPDLDLDRVLAYAIEVAQRKVLFKLFEEWIDLPLSKVFGPMGSEQTDSMCISLLLPERLQDQFCFRSMAALSKLRFVKSERVVLR